MKTFRIVLLVESRTPSHWVAALQSALAGVMSAPYSLDVLIVEDTPRQPVPFTCTLAAGLLEMDRQLRRIGQWTSDSKFGASAPVRGHEAADVLNGSATLSMALRRRVPLDQLAIEACDVMIAMLVASRDLRNALPPSVPMLWAEWEGQVLGTSSHTFLRALAAHCSTVDITIKTAVPGTESRVMLRSRTALRSVSPSLNEELLSARIGDLLAMSAETLRLEPSANASRSTGHTHAAAAERPIDIATLLRVARRRLGATSARMERRSQWALAYRRTERESADESFRNLSQSELLVPPYGTAWADPFAVRYENRDLVFFEQEVAAEGRGHIAVAELLPDGRFGPVHRVLESATHLSYPCVFRHEGEWFMVPESRAAGRVALFRAIDFPHRWEHERDLIVGRNLADATVLYHDGRWWLFACRVGAGQSTFEDLVGYSADSLTGSWRPIGRTPLISDATAGRPAGHLIASGGELFRPAQDGSKRYGYGLALQKVRCITADSYDEHEYLRAAPTWRADLRGVHTFNRSETVTFIDVLRARL